MSHETAVEEVASEGGCDERTLLFLEICAEVDHFYEELGGKYVL